MIIELDKYMIHNMFLRSGTTIKVPFHPPGPLG